jgi:L-glyceraldehyde 3-phosphate reductase
MAYTPSPNRYSDDNLYARCGKSGLKLPRISLGLWHNFGDESDKDAARGMILGAFDLGITHFDLANNYGPPPGAAERTFGAVLKSDLRPWRDEIVVSTKAGYDMWDGPYGDWGSRKYLVASLDKSLLRMGLDYVDIFYHHRPDPQTPLEETMGALDRIVRSGKALYVGLSNYDARQTREAVAILKSLGTPCLIHQTRHNMLDRRAEKDGLLESLADSGIGCIAFSPLAQGILTNRYFDGIPKDSRIARGGPFLHEDDITKKKLEMLRKLDDMAKARGQTLAQMALAWVLSRRGMTSAIVGASKLSQISDSLGALKAPDFTDAELSAIDALTVGEDKS